jgi:hypothetical protein
MKGFGNVVETLEDSDFVPLWIPGGTFWVDKLQRE